jgi:hydrogenase maturation protease
MTRRVLVAGIGNLFLGDDGFGPEVARLLVRSSLPEGVRVVDYGIRGLHLAYDLLDGYDALVIVDALPGDGTPGELRVLEVGEGDVGAGAFDPHGMEPVHVLASLDQPTSARASGCPTRWPQRSPARSRPSGPSCATTSLTR